MKKFQEPLKFHKLTGFERLQQVEPQPVVAHVALLPLLHGEGPDHFDVVAVALLVVVLVAEDDGVDQGHVGVGPRERGREQNSGGHGNGLK